MAYYSDASNCTTWTNWTTDDATAYTTVWNTWCDNGTAGTTGISTTTNATNDEVWYYWTGSNNDIVVINSPIVVKRSLSQRNQEEIYRLWAEVESEWRKEMAKIDAELKAKAEITAQELLLELIGQDELEVYKETGRVLVKGRKFDYLICKGGTVKRLEKDKVVDLCIHLEKRWEFPPTDQVIGLAIMVKADEDAFNSRANRMRSSNRGTLPRAANM